jgi:hypothetical protein
LILIRTHRARRVLATTAAMLAVAVSAAACSSGGGDGGGQQPAAPAAPPAGFATHQGDGYTIDYPSSWTVSEKPNSSGGPPVISILGANGAGGFPPQIAIGHDTNYRSSFDDAMEIFRTVSIGKAGQVVADQPTTLPGAERAQRTEYTLQQQGTGGQQYTIRHIEIHALTPGKTMFDVLVRAPKEDFDRAQLAKALDSFRITTT